MWSPTTRRQHNRAGLRTGSDLADSEWAILLPFLPEYTDRGRKRVEPMCGAVNTISDMLSGGIAWLLMPESFLTWRKVYRCFAELRNDGTWESGYAGV